MLEYRVLGPLEVLREGRPIALGKGAEQALLALLVLRAGRPFTTDELVDSLWGGEAPATAREMVRNYIGSARRRLGGDAIQTTQRGYVLKTESDAADVDRFERLVRESRAVRDVAAREARLKEALHLWRGRPLPELDDVAAAAGDLRQLEELHAATLEDWFDTQLELGRAATTVGALEAFVDEHPFRERPLRQLMLALYRSGRQKEALDRFAAARRRLVHDTGLEPGPELRDLQGRILRQDPSLDLVVLPDSPPVVDAKPRRRRRSLAATALLTAVGGSVAAAAVIVLWPRPHPAVIPRRGVVELDQRTGTPIAATPVAFEPGHIAVADDAVWVGAESAKAVVELRPRPRTVGLPRPPYSLAAIANAVWVGNGFDGTLIRVDQRGHAGAPIRPEPGSIGRLPLAASGDAVWVASQDGTLTELNRAGRTLAVIRGVGLPAAVVADGGSVWVGRATEDAVVRVYVRSRRVQRIPLGDRPSLLATGDRAIWVTTQSTLWRIDPRLNAVTAPIPLPGQATALAATPDGVWVGTEDGLLVEIDPATNKVSRTRLLGRPINSLAGGAGRLWASVG